MGVEDIRRQSLNVYKMRCSAPRSSRSTRARGTLADAVTAALRHWVERVEDTFYVLGSAVGPHPYPMMVRDFQSVIGLEMIDQLPGARRRAASTPSSPAWAAAATRSARSTRSCSAATCSASAAARRRRGGGPGPRHRQDRRVDDARLARRHARLLQLPAPGRGRQPARGVLDLGRARLSGRRPRARVLQGRGPRALRGRSPTPRRSPPSSCSRARRASSRPSSRRTRSRCCRDSPRSSAPTRPSS